MDNQQIPFSNKKKGNKSYYIKQKKEIKLFVQPRSLFNNIIVN